jgi:hypothetical protein
VAIADRSRTPLALDAVRAVAMLGNAERMVQGILSYSTIAQSRLQASNG